MQHLQAIMRQQPHQIHALDTVARCVAACTECAAVCNGCADACLSEAEAGNLAGCIRLNLDCADICLAAGRILGRFTAPRKEPMRRVLEACATSCRACAEECGHHAARHAHCRSCAEACQACAAACEAMLATMPA